MRGLQLHVVLALVAVFAAVGARRGDRPTAPEAEGEPLVDCAPSAVELRGEPSVRVEAGERPVVTVERAEREGRFLGGRAATELLGELGSLRARRSFAADPAADYGFDAATLRVRCPGRTLEWALGGSPPGSADRYLRGPGETVHLIDGAPVRALEEAEVRLLRRELHDFEEAAVARVELRFPGGETRAALQRFADDPRRRRWVEPADPEARAPALDRLMGAHRNLRAEAGAAEPAGTPLAALVFYDEAGESLGALELVREGEGPRARYFVRTDALGWVRVPRATGEAFARAVARVR